MSISSHLTESESDHYFYKLNHIPQKYKDSLSFDEYTTLLLQFAKETKQTESFNYLMAASQLLKSTISDQDFIEKAKQLSILYADPSAAFHLNIDQHVLNNLSKSLNKTPIDVGEVRKKIESIAGNVVTLLDIDNAKRTKIYDDIRQGINNQNTDEQWRFHYESEIEHFFRENLDNANHENDLTIYGMILGACSHIKDPKILEVFFNHVMVDNLAYSQALGQPYEREFIININNLAITNLNINQLPLYIERIENAFPKKDDQHKEIPGNVEINRGLYNSLYEKLALELTKLQNSLDEKNLNYAYIQRIKDVNPAFSKALANIDEAMKLFYTLNQTPANDPNNYALSRVILDKLADAIPVINYNLNQRLLSMIDVIDKIHEHHPARHPEPKTEKEKLHNAKIDAIAELKQATNDYLRSDTKKWGMKEYMETIEKIANLQKKAIEAANKYQKTTLFGRFNFTESHTARTLEGKKSLGEKLKDATLNTVDKITHRFKR